MCLADVAGLLGRSWDTVKDRVKERRAQDHGRPALKGLRALSIDEIDVGREKKFYTLEPLAKPRTLMILPIMILPPFVQTRPKTGGGGRIMGGRIMLSFARASLVIDLESGRIVWVARGKKQAVLKPFWRARRQAKAKIQAVCCDLAVGYWSSVVEPLPKAAVVFDRFHLVKLMNEKLDDLRRALWREAEGLMKQTVKGTRYLRRRRRDKLGEEQLPKLAAALAANEPLWKGYGLKECLGLIWGQTSRRRMEHVWQPWCVLAAGSGVRQLQAMARTVATHAWGILSWWDHPISNGRMEGINNKVKAMRRQH